MRLDPEATISLKCRELIKLLNINLNHFPRHEKYGLCQEIRQAVYGVFAGIVTCQKQYHNKTSLTKLDIQHAQLREFVNLAFEMEYFGFEHHKRVRYVRRHSLHTFSRSMHRGKMHSLISVMGNARHSATYSHFCRRLNAERPYLVSQLPESHRHACTNLQIHPGC